MARSLQDIQSEIISAVTSNAVLAELDSTSQVAIWRLWTFIFATELNIEEQLWDILKEDLELIADSAASGNELWLRDQVLKYQYEDVIQLDENFAPYYPIIDEAKKIVSQVSITETGNRTVVVKTAKGEIGALEPLTTDELNGLQAYLRQVKFAGTNVITISKEPDRLFVEGDVYFDGQYIETTVLEAVKAAITTYLNTIEFNGIVYKQKLEAAILDVPGVTDVSISLIKGRAFDTDFADATTVTRIYSLAAGYGIAEDTVGQTLDDTLNLIAS